jgi:hypothetical protein
MTRPILAAAAFLCLSVWASAQQPADPRMVYPIIPNVGGVVPLSNAAEQPRKGARVVFDITADAKPSDLSKGLERITDVWRTPRPG